jgi:RNA polymerase sigma-70 factor (ECF subfamily)
VKEQHKQASYVMHKSEVGNNAFARNLYNEFSAELFEYALMMTANHSDAEDAIQNVFMRILRKTSDLEPKSWLAYLKTAVRNECYDLVKTKRKRLTKFRELSEKSVLVPVDSSNKNIGENTQLEVAIKKLPIEQREVLYLKLFKQMSFREIGYFLDQPNNTVASRYRYGIAKLRLLLESNKQELFDDH